MFHDLPPQDVRTPWRIVRTPHDKVLTFTAGCRTWRGKFNHWFGGKTVECLGENECEACKRGMRPRWEGYIVGIGKETGNRAIVCLTAAAAGDLERYELGEKLLLGAVITMRRPSGKTNGGVYAAISGWEKVGRPTPMQELEEIVDTIYGKHKYGKPRSVIV